MYEGQSNFATNTGSISLKMPQVDQRQGQVIAGLEQLHKATDELRAALSNLEARIDTVLAPEQLTDEKANGSVPEPVRAPLAGELHARTSDILWMTKKVNYLMTRIEL